MQLNLKLQKRRQNRTGRKYVPLFSFSHVYYRKTLKVRHVGGKIKLFFSKNNKMETKSFENPSMEINYCTKNSNTVFKLSFLLNLEVVKIASFHLRGKWRRTSQNLLHGLANCLISARSDDFQQLRVPDLNQLAFRGTIHDFVHLSKTAVS